MSTSNIERPSRRGLLLMAAAAGATLAMPRLILARRGQGADAKFGGDLAAVRAAIEKQRSEAIKRLQNWIALPSIAAENRNMKEGCQMMVDLLKEAGFQSATMMPTDGQPGVFATLDAGAKRTVGMYFMYDVKQFDPSEWSSPPLERRHRRQGAVRQGDDRPRRHQPEGTGGHLPRRLACAQGGRPQAAGQYRAGRGRRGGDRLAAFRPGGASSRSPCGARQMPRGIHALRLAVAAGRGGDRPGRQRASSRSSWWPRRKNGAAAPRTTSIRATRPSSTAPCGAWSRRCRRWCRRTAMILPSMAGSSTSSR